MGVSQYHLWLDLEAGTFVQGRNSTQALSLLRPVKQGDTPDVILHGLVRDTDPASTSVYKESTINAVKIQCGISQEVDAVPKGGTIKLNVGADVTPEITPSNTKAEIAAMLNALPSVSALGGLTVDASGAANILIIRWVDPDEVTEIEVVENRLTPKSFARVYFYNGAEDKFFVVKWFVAPFAFTDQFSSPLPPTVSVLMVREGSAARNEVQALKIPTDATGEFAVKHEGLATTVLPVVGVNAGQIENALNALFTDNVLRFRVSQPAANLFYVEFIGPLAKTDVAVLEVDMYNQTALPTPKASLPLTGIPLEVIQQGAKSFPAMLEVVLVDGVGRETTFGPTPVTVINDMLDSEMSLNIPDWLVSAEEAAVISDPNIPLISGTISWAVTFGNDADDMWDLNHGLGTEVPIVEIFQLSPYQRVPDNEYLLEVLNANTVRVVFAGPVAENSLRIVVINPEAQTVLNNHTHPISHVDDLQAELDALWATFESFEISSPLPLSMIPKLPWSWVGWSDEAGTQRQTLPDSVISGNIPRLDPGTGTLPVTVLPPSVPRVDENGNLVVSHTNPDGTVTTITLYSFEEGFSTEVIEKIAEKLVSSPAFNEAVITVLQAGGTLPAGTFVMSVEDVDLTLPAKPAVVTVGETKLTFHTPLPVAFVGAVLVGIVESGGLASGFYYNHYIGAPNGTALKVGDTVFTVTAENVLSPLGAEYDGYHEVTTEEDASGVNVGDLVYLVDAVDAADISGDLPATGTVGQRRTVDTKARSRDYLERRGEVFPDGAVIVYNGRFWQRITEEGLFWYPWEMEREFFVLAITERQLAVDSQLLVTVPLQVQLAGSTRGRLTFFLEVGTAVAEVGGSNLKSYTWQTALEEELPLNTTLDFHNFGLKVVRSAGGLTAKVLRYGRESASPVVPANGNFAVRARMGRFDVEDQAEPRGTLTVRVRGARASVAPVDV